MYNERLSNLNLTQNGNNACVGKVPRSYSAEISKFSTGIENHSMLRMLRFRESRKILNSKWKTLRNDKETSSLKILENLVPRSLRREIKFIQVIQVDEKKKKKEKKRKEKEISPFEKDTKTSIFDDFIHRTLDELKRL